LPPERVPIIQKLVIQRAGVWRKPVITATQMLESMTENPRPTRAEASDVANAIFDGTDVVMLSGETASGRYPREAVAIMAKIVLEAESAKEEPVQRRRQHRHLSISETICESVAHAAQDLEMKAIAVFTESGTTARLISKYRPKAPVYAFAALPAVTARLPGRARFASGPSRERPPGRRRPRSRTRSRVPPRDSRRGSRSGLPP